MFLIKLTKESGDKLWRVQSSDLTWEIGTVTKVATGSKKEDLDTGMSAFFVKRNYIGFAQTAHVYILVCLYLG